MIRTAANASPTEIFLNKMSWMPPLISEPRVRPWLWTQVRFSKRMRDEGQPQPQSSLPAHKR